MLNTDDNDKIGEFPLVATRQFRDCEESEKTPLRSASPARRSTRARDSKMHFRGLGSSLCLINENAIFVDFEERNTASVDVRVIFGSFSKKQRHDLAKHRASSALLNHGFF